MQSKISSKWFVFIVCVVGIILTIFLLNTNTPVQSSYQDISIQKQEDLGLPARLKIPSINVDAHFEYVGLTADGAMDVPKGPLNVGWFDIGPRPGESGSAVIAGHSGFKNGRAAVFDNLNKIKKGDKIYTEDANGTTAIFIVRELRSYKPKADAIDVFTSNDGLAHLNLITCSGVWDVIDKSHSSRLVVFADKVLN